MRGKFFFFSLMILGFVLIGLAMALIENGARHQTRNEILDIVRAEQRACQDANVILQEYQRAKDCTPYGNLLEKIEDTRP